MIILRALSVLAISYLVIVADPVRTTPEPVPQSIEERLDQVIHDFDPLQNASTVDAFRMLLQHENAPGGIIEINECSNPTQVSKPPHSGDFNGFTVRQVLDRLVAEDPAYKWQLDGGAVDLVPSTGVPPILEIHLTHFQLRPDDAAPAIGGKLFAEPSVEKALQDLKLKKEDRLEVYIGSAPPTLGKSVKLHDATLAHILNVAASNHKYHAVWHYRETTGHCDHTYSLDWPVR